MKNGRFRLRMHSLSIRVIRVIRGQEFLRESIHAPGACCEFFSPCRLRMHSLSIPIIRVIRGQEFLRESIHAPGVCCEFFSPCRIWMHSLSIPIIRVIRGQEFLRESIHAQHGRCEFFSPCRIRMHSLSIRVIRVIRGQEFLRESIHAQARVANFFRAVASVCTLLPSVSSASSAVKNSLENPFTPHRCVANFFPFVNSNLFRISIFEFRICGGFQTAEFLPAKINLKKLS